MFVWFPPVDCLSSQEYRTLHHNQSRSWTSFLSFPSRAWVGRDACPCEREMQEPSLWQELGTETMSYYGGVFLAQEQQKDQGKPRFETKNEYSTRFNAADMPTDLNIKCSDFDQ